MNKEYLKNLRNWLSAHLTHHSREACCLDEDDWRQNYHINEIKYYAFMNRLINATMEPIEPFLPDIEEK